MAGRAVEAAGAGEGAEGILTVSPAKMRRGSEMPLHLASSSSGAPQRFAMRHRVSPAMIRWNRP